jgi:hypothetical protein
VHCSIKEHCTILQKGSAMSVSIKTNAKDETRIGDYAAKQPLSGINIVNRMYVKGASNSAFIRMEEKKAV